MFTFWLQGLGPQKAGTQKIMVLISEVRELDGGGLRGKMKVIWKRFNNRKCENKQYDNH